MALVPSAPGLENYTGMDDLSPEDLTMPRLAIGSNENAGVFIDSQTSQKFSEVDIIILGIIKQRILWPATMGDQKSNPLCRSYDFDRGHTDEDKFPWKQSGYDKAVILGTEDKTIPCDACPLKDWGSHPAREKVPWCNEQIVLAILLAPSYSPAILTVQGSGLKPTRAYLTSFTRDRLPPFNCVTHVELDVNTRGTVTYSVPRFSKPGEQTDVDKYGEYVTTYEGMRRFVQTPRSRDDENTDATPATSTAKSTPAPAPVAASDVDADDDGPLPF